MGGSSSKSLTYPRDVDLSGRLAIVTGANTGIGAHTAEHLAESGAHVIVACRNVSAGAERAEAINRACGAVRAECAQLDLADFSSIRAFAERVLARGEHVRILVLNAGLATAQPGRTRDNFDIICGTNHFGHFLLTLLLLNGGAFSASERARIVVLSSNAHYGASIDWSNLRFENERWPLYRRSKFMNLLFTTGLARRLRDARLPITVNAVHPGVVRTQFVTSTGCCGNVFLCCFGCCMKTPDEGSHTTLQVAMAPELDDVTGEYFQDSHVARADRRAYDPAMADRLWTASEQLVGLSLALPATDAAGAGAGAGTDVDASAASAARGAAPTGPSGGERAPAGGDADHV